MDWRLVRRVLGQQADQAAGVQIIADEIIRHENYSCMLEHKRQKRLAIVRQQSPWKC